MTPEPLTIVVPMAGDGARFSAAGYTLPKPLIDIRGVPMIRRVLDNLAVPAARFVVITRDDLHAAHRERLEAAFEGHRVTVSLIDHRTEGAACTVLHVVRTINVAAPLLIANADQLVDMSLSDFVADAEARGLDGSILTFEEPGRDPKWSYARLDERGLVSETREKVAISTHATVGLYWFREGRAFVEAACEMIASNDRCNGEFYVCPVYNYAIRAGQRIGIHDLPSGAMHGLGTPEDVARYLALP